MDRVAPYALLFLLLLPLATKGQGGLRAGPMLGHCGHRTVRVWAQTKGPSELRLLYWPVKGKGDTLRSEPVKSKASNAYTAHLVADSLVPGQRYAYRIRSNGRTLKGDPTWTFSSQSLLKDLERPSSFRMALGSCAFFNDPAHDNMEDPYGQHYGIFQAIAEKNPELMLWLGDNIYLRRSDLSSQEGFYHRYSRSRRMDSLKGLLSATHHYAIWDDHDFGPNNSDRSFPFADRSLKAFRRFWMSEAYEADGFPGITGSFRYQDIEVFLLDDRWFRTPQDKKSGTRQLLGEAQIEWLIEGLLTSKAPFKLVAMGGQVLNPAAVYETYAQFPEERKRLLERIQEEGIEGVIFLTGDRHHSELSKWEPDTGLTVYDLTVSPLTSSPADNRDEANEWRVEGTYVAKNNFAVLRIHGPLEDRKLSIKVFDHRGELLWERGIEAP